MFSQRVPRDRSPNEWASRLEARRAAGVALLDLTEANPTIAGLSRMGPLEIAALAAGAAAEYRPQPRGLAGARAAIVEYYAARGLDADPAAMVLTSGTSEAYAHLFRLLADPGDRVLVPAPSYPLFEPIAALEGVRVASYALAWDGQWHLDVASLERELARGARAVVVVQPNHPTGSCLSADEIATLDSLCASAGAAIIADEVFLDYVWNDSGAGLPSLLADRRALTFVLSGLSKVCGLPQLKLGWIAACGPSRLVEEAVSGLEWIADLFLSVAMPVQVALPELLRGRREFQRRVLERIAVNRVRLGLAAERSPECSVLAARGGWHAVMRLPGRRSEEQWMNEFLARGVIVHPGHFYDFAVESFAVVSLIADPLTFDDGLTRIEQSLVES